MKIGEGNSCTLDMAFPFCAPGNNLIFNVTFSINNYHWDSRVRKVWYAFVADDGDKFCAGMMGG